MDKPNWTILHNKLPPTQRVGLVRASRDAASSSSSHSSFCEEVFSRVATEAGVVDSGRGQRPRLQRMRWIGQIFWLLAYVPIFVGITFFPPSPPKGLRGLAQLGSRIQLQQRNCSRFSRDFLRRSTFSSSQRTGLRSSGLRLAVQDIFSAEPQIAGPLRQSSRRPPASLLVRQKLEGSRLASLSR